MIGSVEMRWLPVVAFLVFAAPAAAEPSYTLIGAGSAPLRDGVAASDVLLDGASAIASRDDGVLAFASSGRVFWVEHGVVSRVRVPVADRVDVAFAPDGTLVVSTCAGFGERAPSAVWRVAPGRPPALLAGNPMRRGSSGDGGPATRARLRCPLGIDVQLDGGVLIADSAANLIRRVAPDGAIATVAGTGRDASRGDGGLAVQAAVLPNDVAALPGGGFAISDLGPESKRLSGGIRTIDTGVVRSSGLTASSRLARPTARIGSQPNRAGICSLSTWPARTGGCDAWRLMVA